MYALVKNMSGQRFGRLIVIEHNGSTVCGKARWLCQCECGTKKSVPGYKLRSGEVRSCGCLKRESGATANKKHGGHGTSEYTIWSTMKARCHRPTSGDYPAYGGRGIAVCDRWLHSFADFLADMGPRPSLQHSIDRFPDKAGNYEPSNCRWATTTEQARNRRSNRIVTVDGKQLSLAAAAEMLGLNYNTAHRRLRNGWSNDRALGISE